MFRAVMLIKSGGRVPKAFNLAKELKRMRSVSDAYAVFGRFDIVAFLESDEISEIFKDVSEATKLSGITSSESLIEVKESDHPSDYGKGPFSS